MRNTTTAIALTLGLLLVAALPALGQSGAAEVRGKVVDNEGNPVATAMLVFTNPAKPDVKYEARTDKKGRFYLSNLIYDPNSKRWNLEVQHEGYLPTHIDVTSRTQLAIVDKFSSDIKRGQQIPPMLISAFGKVQLDLVLTPEDQVPGAETVAAPGAAVAVVEQAPAPAQDPWNAAIGAAAGGDLEGSLESFDKAVAAAPEDAERRTAYAKVLYQLERYGPAAKQAVRATQLAPESLDAQMVLYSVYVATNNLAAGAAALEQARAIAPQDLRVLEQTAYLASRTGDTEAEIDAYRTITEVAPDNADAWVSLGDLYAREGQVELSEQAYQRVVELNPQDAYTVFYNLGALIMNRPNLSEADSRKAAEAFRRAIEIKPDYAQAHQQLAFALLGTGDLQGARRSLQRYLELRPKAPDAPDMKALIDTLGR